MLLDYINTQRKTYKYYLKFDISKFFVTIKHDILLEQIRNAASYDGQAIGEKGSYYIETCIPNFLESSPFENTSLQVSSTLSHTLSSIYLARLDIQISTPYVRYVDDYIVMFKTRKEIDIFMTEILLPTLRHLHLEISLPKTQSGRFAEGDVVFLGYKLSRGIISISSTAIEKFEKQIKALTIANKTEIAPMIEKINHKIVGFGNYYKIARCTKTFEDLDKYIRARIRRALSSSEQKQNNILLSNTQLTQMGLKTLSTYAGKKTTVPKEKNKATYEVVSFATRLDRIEKRMTRIEKILQDILDRLV